jgi:hypothetical protein
MIHVYPLNDIKEHTLESTCECKPKIISESNSEMICVHNSFDGREGVEWANEIINKKYMKTKKNYEKFLKKNSKLDKHLIEINNRFFYLSIQKLDNCLYSRRNGYRGNILFGHNIFFYFKKIKYGKK